MSRKPRAATVDPREAVSRWTRGQFVFKASFYTGRDPSTSDLSSQMLERIYQGIKREIGQEEATNFARLVANQRDLSASAFAQALEKFWYTGCKNPDIVMQIGSGEEITGRSEEQRYMEVFVLLANTLSSTKANSKDIEDLSRAIKHRFVEDHKNEINSQTT